jgi:hypothetical protein
MRSSTQSQTATDATAEFFERLAQRGYEPLLRKTKGAVRLDLTSGRQTANWLITIDRGNLGVSHENSDAQCIVRTEKRIFDQVVRGEANAMAAVLRGAMEMEGDPELLVLFQRLLPGPRRTSDPRRAAGYAQRKS